MVRLEIPRLALVVLVGAAGAGKSSFARAHFQPTQVVSSDACRALVADDEADQSATPAAFEVLRLITSLRLRRGRLTVVDAVNARPADRLPLLELAATNNCPAVAIVLDLPVEECVARDRARPGRTVGERVVRAHWTSVRHGLQGLGEEGFQSVHLLSSAEAVERTVVRLVPLPADRRWDRGPFDVIGDVHGRLDQLLALLVRLGYRVEAGGGAGPRASHPGGRRAVFVGDLCGDGPDQLGVVQLVMGMAAANAALSVLGDRDERLAPALPPEERRFLEALPSHLVLAGGSLVVAHAGIRRELQGRESEHVRRFCLHGEPGWAETYRGRALVVHGHYPADRPRWLGRTLCLDTVGHAAGRLSALRHPELELVTLPG